MKILVFRDGNTRAITGEDGKYWLTGEDRVRKLSASIAEVREIEDPAPVTIKLKTDPPAELGGKVSTAKPKKKTEKKAGEDLSTTSRSPSPKGEAKKRRKKEDTEAEADGERGK